MKGGISETPRIFSRNMTKGEGRRERPLSLLCCRRAARREKKGGEGKNGYPDATSYFGLSSKSGEKKEGRRGVTLSAIRGRGENAVMFLSTIRRKGGGGKEKDVVRH